MQSRMFFISISNFKYRAMCFIIIDYQFKAHFVRKSFDNACLRKMLWLSFECQLIFGEYGLPCIPRPAKGLRRRRGISINNSNVFNNKYTVILKSQFHSVSTLLLWYLKSIKDKGTKIRFFKGRCTIDIR